jgi:serine/threonine protein kinase
MLSPLAANKPTINLEQASSSSDLWLHLKKDYKLIKFLGEGSFGQVKLGQCRVTKRLVAIKLIKDFADCEYNSIKVAREISIMRNIAENSKSENLLCPALLDLIYIADFKTVDGK